MKCKNYFRIHFKAHRVASMMAKRLSQEERSKAVYATKGRRRRYEEADLVFLREQVRDGLSRQHYRTPCPVRSSNASSYFLLVVFTISSGSAGAGGFLFQFSESR